MGRKFQRGLANIALSPLELSRSIADMNAKDTFIPGWFTGFLHGSAAAFCRASIGVYEVVTAPIPFPANYKPILDPEFPSELAESSDT